MTVTSLSSHSTEEIPGLGSQTFNISRGMGVAGRHHAMVLMVDTAVVLMVVGCGEGGGVVLMAIPDGGGGVAVVQMMAGA